jgi:hypothetical protein
VSQDPRLTAGEFQLRRALRSASAPPFIAYCELPPRSQESIALGLRAFLGGSPERLPRALEVYPATTSWLIAAALLENYGAEDHRIYAPICANLALRDIPNQIRAAINRQFRRACSRLGLIVAGAEATGFVDDYILQAGVAKAQLPALIEAFLRAEAVLGSPPDEDTQRLNAWEVRASDFAHPGYTRLRNIMRWDESAYHAGAFARARRNEPPTNAVEADIGEIVRQLAQAKGFSRTAANEPLRLLFLEDSLVLAAPAATGVFVDLPGREKWIGPGRRFNLAPPWPDAVRWRRESDEHTEQVSVMPEEAPAALFSAEDGSLLRRLAAGESKPIAASVSEVVIVARSPFRAGGLHSLDLGSNAHALITTVQRGGTVITLGQQEYTITPPQRPTVEIIGPRVARGTPGSLFGSPQAIEVEFPNGRPDGALSLQVKHAALSEPLVIDIPEGEAFRFDLQDSFPQRGPAGPLSASVTFREGSRVLVRSSNWVWPGLNGFVDGSCFDGPVPPNYSDQSMHLSRNDEARLCLDLSQRYRAALLCFDTAGGSTAQFEIARPGTNLAIVDEDGREQPLEEGCRLAALPGSTSALIIRSDDAEAALDIRGVVYERAFGRSGKRRLGLSSLSGPALNDKITLLPHGERALSRTLLEVASAASPTSFRLEKDRWKGSVRVTASFPVLVDAARLIITDLASGEQHQIDAPLSSREVPHADPMRLNAELVGAGATGTEVHLRLGQPQLWPKASVAAVEIRRRGEDRWNRLRNSRGDDYIVLPAGDLATDEISKPESLFLRLTELLNRCYAPECWDAVVRVQKLWRATGLSLAESQSGQRALLRAWGSAIPVDVSSTWVPLRHPIEIAPDLLGADPVDFFVLEDAEADGLSELGALRRVAGLEQVQNAGTDLSVDGTFFLGFENFAHAIRDPNARLLGFDIQRLLRNPAGERVELAAFWKPDDGRLTRRHHAWCIGHFIDRFEQVGLSGTEANANRIQRINQLVHSIPRQERSLAFPADERLADRLPLVLALPAFASAMARAGRYGDSRAFWESLSATVQRPSFEILEDAGFLLRLAPELTAFYLLLWELVRRTEF